MSMVQLLCAVRLPKPSSLRTFTAGCLQLGFSAGEPAEWNTGASCYLSSNVQNTSKIYNDAKQYLQRCDFFHQPNHDEITRGCFEILEAVNS